MCISWHCCKISYSIIQKSIPVKPTFALTRISRDWLFLVRVIARAEQTEHVMKASMSQSHVTTAAQRKSCRFADVTKERSQRGRERRSRGAQFSCCGHSARCPLSSCCKAVVRQYFQYLNILLNQRQQFSFTFKCPLVFMTFHSVFNAKSV